jgi:hypothetical protein
LIGVDINPAFIEQAQRVVDASANLTDKQKLIAEFWEDGPGTGFPPGTWVEFGRYASELYDNTRQEDVRMFFGIGQALLSASVSSWGLKTETDYTRPSPPFASSAVLSCSMMSIPSLAAYKSMHTIAAPRTPKKSMVQTGKPTRPLATSIRHLLQSSPLATAHSHLRPAN